MTDKKLTKPPHEPDARSRSQVKTLVSMGASHDDICRVIGVSKPTMYKYYREELDAGAIEANATVAQSLFQQATNKDKPNVVAAIFWLKARAGWRDADPREGVGKKEQRQQDADEVASSSRFGVQRPPLKVVK